jgi:hypothetical protein
MERGQARDSIQRLLAEAAQISPAIAQAQRKGRVEPLADDGVDQRKAERWIQETTNLARVLQRVYGGPFVELFHQQADDTTRDDARSLSERIDSIRRRLESMLPLLGPSVRAPVSTAPPAPAAKADPAGGGPRVSASAGGRLGGMPAWVWALAAIVIGAAAFAALKFWGAR